MASSPPSRGWMKKGCLSGLPDFPVCWVGYHSKYPSAGRRQRRDAKARLYAGFSATVSIRALIIRLPIDGSLAHEGTMPQVSTRSWRSGGSGLSLDPAGFLGGRSTTAYTSLVGATL